MGHNPEHYGGGSVKLRRSAPGTVATTILGRAKLFPSLRDPAVSPAGAFPGGRLARQPARRPEEAGTDSERRR